MSFRTEDSFCNYLYQIKFNSDEKEQFKKWRREENWEQFKQYMNSPHHQELKNHKKFADDFKYPAEWDKDLEKEAETILSITHYYTIDRRINDIQIEKEKIGEHQRFGKVSAFCAYPFVESAINRIIDKASYYDFDGGYILLKKNSQYKHWTYFGDNDFYVVPGFKSRLVDMLEIAIWTISLSWICFATMLPICIMVFFALLVFLIMLLSKLQRLIKWVVKGFEKQN